MSDRSRARRGAPTSRSVPGGGPRFEVREEESGWVIEDRRDGTVAELGGRRQVGLVLEEAEELTRILNRLEAQQLLSDAARRVESGD